ncbi:MAG: DUF2007 domain-containing protein [Chloroflexi bacterium]|nr:DUF2007 domain-containing protein [Chloroflexota bacterium]
MIEVYRAKGELEAHVIKGLLESNGIPCFLKWNTSPSVFAFVADGLGEVKVMVDEQFAEDAKELITRRDDA